MTKINGNKASLHASLEKVNFVRVSDGTKDGKRRTFSRQCRELNVLQASQITGCHLLKGDGMQQCWHQIKRDFSFSLT